MVAKLFRLHPDAVLPRYEHPGDAGLDLFTVEDVELKPGGRAGVATGWAIEFPDGYVARILGRSGWALKYGVSAAMSGVIDAGYRGEWKVILNNFGTESCQIRKGDKIAQALFYPVARATVAEVGELSASARGTGGFGGSGFGASVKEKDDPIQSS